MKLASSTGASRRAPAVTRVRGTERHRDNGIERTTSEANKNAPKLTGRANAVTRGRGRKVGLRRPSNQSTSSAASKFSKAARKSYVKMNMKNSARSAGIRLANTVTNAQNSSSGGGIPRVTPQWQLFGGIGDAIRRATGK